MCVCVCVCEGGREGGREGVIVGRWVGERERWKSVIFVKYPFIFLISTLIVPSLKNKIHNNNLTK